MRLVIACCCTAAVLLGVAGTGLAGRAPSAEVLRADVAEWNLVPSAGTVRAGHVRIVVHNLGAVSHQVVLVRTQAFAERLRLDGARAVTRPIATAVTVAPGERASFDVVLTRGSYLLLDNLPWHYWKGTSAAFSVR